MTEQVLLPPGMSLAIIAFLLSLLPAGLFMWLWYLRRRDNTIPARAVATAFGLGLILVWPAFWLEDFAEEAWLTISPATAHLFAGAVLPLQNPLDVLLPAIGTFLIVAVIEEGLRYILLRFWIWKSAVLDQVFDGLLVGVAVGLGFATLENTIYFLDLFRDGSYDTLVFVFFLRFLISTLAHVSFGGLMGTFLARGLFNIYNARQFTLPAFFLPWFLHGLYDLLLGINQSFYAVLLLLPALLVVVMWSGRRDFFIIHRKHGRLLVNAEAPMDTQKSQDDRRLVAPSPWNVEPPWLVSRRAPWHRGKVL